MFTKERYDGEAWSFIVALFIEKWEIQYKEEFDYNKLHLYQPSLQEAYLKYLRSCITLSEKRCFYIIVFQKLIELQNRNFELSEYYYN